jgi:hypothetical protein
VIDPASVQDVQDPTGAFSVDRPGVGQRVSYHQPFSGHTVSVERVLEDLFNHPLGASPGLTESPPGQGQADQPVACGWDLFGPTGPPPFIIENLSEDLFGQPVNELVALLLWEERNTFSQGETHMITLARFDQGRTVLA